jgi:APA family basic amino acid/polyamine antiporter
MAKDGMFFSRAGVLNKAHTPGWALAVQGVWAAVLVLPRTYDTGTHQYGNLYSDLLNYVISAALLFYILTIAGVFRLRQKRPNADRPYKVIGYPLVPGFYIAGATAILIILFQHRASTTWPGLVIVLIGAAVYAVVRRKSA